MEKEAKGLRERKILAFLFGCVTTLGLLLFPQILIRWVSPRFDSYSLALTVVDGFSQRPAAAGGPGGPPLSPVFNLTLCVENTRVLSWESCFSHGRVAVSYGGGAMGEGRVPGLCAGARSTAEVRVVARGRDGVRLPDGLRRRMEAELRWGATELDVEAELFRDDDTDTRGAVLLRCRPAGPQVPSQPLRCKAFTDCFRV